MPSISKGQSHGSSTKIQERLDWAFHNLPWGSLFLEEDLTHLGFYRSNYRVIRVRLVVGLIHSVLREYPNSFLRLFG